MTYEDLLIEIANLSEEQLKREVIIQSAETDERVSLSDVDWVTFVDHLDSDQPIILF